MMDLRLMKKNFYLKQVENLNIFELGLLEFLKDY
jgi:hypothetical protein